MTALPAGAALREFTHGPVAVPAMAAFATILDDPNPIHTSADAARAAGLGEHPINQGPANFGYIITMLRRAAPGAHLADLQVRLLANVVEGDRVVAGGRVDAEDEDGAGGRRVSCSVWLDVEGGRRAVEGTATLLVPAGR
jgi:acyl dehydratase